MAWVPLGLISYSSHWCCGQFHTVFEQLGSSVIRAFQTHSRSSDFLPRDLLMLSVCPMKGLAILQAQSLLVGGWTNGWMVSLFYFWSGWFWNPPEIFLELSGIKQTIFPWGGQFNNICLNELSHVFSLLQGPLFWLPKITLPNKPFIC